VRIRRAVAVPVADGRGGSNDGDNEVRIRRAVAVAVADIDARSACGEGEADFGHISDWHETDRVEFLQ
jgi:hypothetical protein